MNRLSNAHLKLPSCCIVSEPFVVVQVNGMLIVRSVETRAHEFIVIGAPILLIVLFNSTEIAAIWITERVGVRGTQRVAFLVKFDEFVVVTSS